MTCPSVTAAVIARDEERRLAGCLASLSWADERLVVVDAATRDRTGEVARRLGARVEVRAFQHFADQRQQALDLARGEWVLFVDADERVPDALRAEIQAVLAQPGHLAGCWIPRHNYLMGRLVRGGGWYPDFQLRLLRRGSARYDPAVRVHEVAVLTGPSCHLREPLVHENYRTLAEFVRKQERYCRLDAERWLVTMGPPRGRALLGQPVREFWRRYIHLRGYTEGPLGLLLCLLLAYYALRRVWLARSWAGVPASAVGGRRPELIDVRDGPQAAQETAE